MRSAVALAAFAAGALAVPYHRHHNKRDILTDVDVVVKTAFVTVTAGSPEPTAAKPTTPVAAPVTTTTVAPAPAKATQVATPHENWSNHVNSAEVHSSDGVEIFVTTIVGGSTPSAAPAAPKEEPASPAAKPVEAPSAAPVSSGSTSTPSTYSEIALYHHNIHRANHSAPAMTWSEELAGYAAQTASLCYFAHNNNAGGGGYGQNIAAGVDPQNISSVITDLFYNGEVGWYNGLYGQAQPSMANFNSWGHFSQLVWKTSTQVGCATQYCPNGLGGTGGDVDPYFTVCDYTGVGNMANEYGSNIGEPLGHPTAQWNTGL